MSFLKDFKAFALKGSVVDLAIAVIIGAAFGAIISSLVDDIITPLLLSPALKMAHLEDVSQLTWGAVKYGNFISAVIKFVIIALVLFMIIRTMMKMKRKEEMVPAPPPQPGVEERLLTEIRDALLNR